MKPFDTIWVDDTIEFDTTAPTLTLASGAHGKVRQKKKGIPPLRVLFQRDPFQPRLQGTLIIEGTPMGQSPLNAQHLSKQSQGALDMGLFQSVSCWDADGNLLAQWTFQTPTQDQVMVSQNRVSSEIWEMRLDPHGISGQQQVYLIPIGGIWRDPTNLETLDQAYGFLGLGDTGQTVWHIVDRGTLAQKGIVFPHHTQVDGKTYVFVHPEAPPFVSLRDMATVREDGDMIYPLYPRHMDPIHPVLNETTLFF